MSVWDAAISEHCPSVTVRWRRPACPWLREDAELTLAMEQCDEARRTWEACRTPRHRAEYTRHRNKVKTELARARRDFLCGPLLSDRSFFWSRIKEFAFRPARPAESTEDDISGRADLFNEHFASVGSRIASEVRSVEATDRPGPRPPRVVSSSLTLKPVTLPELSKAVRLLKPSRAVGVDGVPLEAIRKCFAVIGPHLLHVINKSITTCVFPESWKIAAVTPIHKAGDRADVNNFRPISILSVLSKVAEKVVCMQLMSYLLCNHVLSPYQYAYRPCHSTEDALIDAVEWLSKVIDKGNVASLTTLDLSKAFDSVDHGVLLDKLEWCGVHSEWFRSYLCDRRQMVRDSSILPLTHGVPQGSIVGPILFILFINDLSSFLPHGRLLSYADDTQLLDQSPPDGIGLSQLRTRVEESVRHLQTWFRSNSLKMNPDKTCFTLFGTHSSLKKASGFHITLSGSNIPPRPSVKVLGVILDQSLTWESHISSVVRKCNAIILSLYKTRHHFTSHALQLLVQAHVFPHILYCLSVWGGASQTRLRRVQKCVNFAARLVTGTRRNDHIMPALSSLGWLRIEDMVRRRDCLHVYRAVRDDSCPPALSSLFIKRSDVSQRETRATVSGELQLERCRLSVTQRGFSYRAAALWNGLPDSVTSAPNRGKFLSALSDVRF